MSTPGQRARQQKPISETDAKDAVIEAARKRAGQGHDVNCAALARKMPRADCTCGQDELLDALRVLRAVRP